MSDTIDGYAEALLAVVRAEGATGADDEIFRFAQALEGNDELRNTLSDPYVPAEKRQQIVEDLLQVRVRRDLFERLRRDRFPRGQIYP